MHSRLLAIPLLVLLAACPGDKKVVRRADTTQSTAAASLDTTAMSDTARGDLSSVQTSLPPAEPDTFKRRTLASASEGRRSSGTREAAPSIPAAPGPLMEAVQREQSFSRFCYQEFGQKSDPSLAGNVAMVVTVGDEGITDARVEDSNWSSRNAGSAVNRCLNERAKLAWKLPPGSVHPGRYVVQLAFRGS